MSSLLRNEFARLRRNAQAVMAFHRRAEIPVYRCEHFVGPWRIRRRVQLVFQRKQNLEMVAGDDGLDDRYIYKRDMAWLTSGDLVVAEVTTPSLGVGYELGWATALKKPVLCLYRIIAGRPLSAMIGGSPGIQTAEYSSIDEAEKIMEEFIKKTSKGNVKA